MNLTLQGCCKCFKRTIFAFQSGSNFWPKLFVHCWTSAPLLTFPLLMKELQIRTHTSLRLAAELKETALGFFFTAFSLYKPQICCWVTQPLPAFLWDQAVKQGEAKQCRGYWGLDTPGTALALPLAPVGGRQHCWLNKQVRHPTPTAVMSSNMELECHLQ